MYWMGRLLINRWLLSTNAKDIGVQYIIFAGLSGLVGSSLSFKIRKELAGGGNVYFLGNYHDYNVTITGHAIQKIFFKVKPAKIGGFGKVLKILKELEKTFIKSEEIASSDSKEVKNDSTKVKKKPENFLGSYLAGLIEGDGTIIVPDPSNKKRYAIIRICFNIKDLPLAKKLKEKIEYGKIVYPKEGHYVLLEITSYAGLYKTAVQTNGYFRTPKLEAQNRQIDWLNMRVLDDQKKEPLKKRTLDWSSITSNAWLAGKIDADGKFNVIIAPRKNKTNIRIQAQFRLELRQLYPRSILENNRGTYYIDIKSVIATYQGVNVYNRARLLKGSFTYKYFFVASSIRSQELVKNYLNKYTLYSSKYLDFKDWCKIIDINNSKEPKKDIILKATKIKSGINNKRIIFTWSHIENL